MTAIAGPCEKIGRVDNISTFRVWAQRREHRTPLSAAALLADMKKPATGDCVFPGKKPDQPLSNIKQTWASVCQKADVKDARIHDLRDSFAPILVSRGASGPLIGALLGQTQIATTARYAHLYDEPLREAVEQVGSALGRRDSETTGADNIQPLRR